MSRIPILFTGADGMFGSDLKRYLAEMNIDAYACNHAALDITDQQRVSALIERVRPQVVIHAAAATHVDQVELAPEIGARVNVTGTANVAFAAASIDATMIYISSCGVFDGLKGVPYHEYDSPAPQTHYALTKFAGESAVRRFCQQAFIVRAGWLFGGERDHAKNFVAARQREAYDKGRLQSAADKFGSPSYTYDLARVILELSRSDAYGLYHAANVGMASRYEYVAEIVRLLKLRVEVEPVGSGLFPRPAPVPRNEALENRRLKEGGFAPMRAWKDALADYVQNRFAV